MYILKFLSFLLLILFSCSKKKDDQVSKNLNVINQNLDDNEIIEDNYYQIFQNFCIIGLDFKIECKIDTIKQNLINDKSSKSIISHFGVYNQKSQVVEWREAKLERVVVDNKEIYKVLPYFGVYNQKYEDVEWREAKLERVVVDNNEIYKVLPYFGVYNQKYEDVEWREAKLERLEIEDKVIYKVLPYFGLYNQKYNGVEWHESIITNSN